MIAFFTSPLGKLATAGLVLLAIWGGFKIWLASHDQELLSGYVLLAQKTAAEAERDEIKRQLKAGQIVIDSYQVQLKNQRVKDAAEDAAALTKEKEYAENLKALGDSCGLTDADLDFILRQ